MNSYKWKRDEEMGIVMEHPEACVELRFCSYSFVCLQRVCFVALSRCLMGIVENDVRTLMLGLCEDVMRGGDSKARVTSLRLLN